MKKKFLAFLEIIVPFIVYSTVVGIIQITALNLWYMTKGESMPFTKEGLMNSPYMVPSIAIATIPTAILMLAWLKYESNKLHRPNPFTYHKSMFILIPTAIFLSYGLNFILGIIQLDKLSPGFESVQNTLYSPSLLWQIIAIGIIVPIGEESLFRGIGYHMCRKHLSMIPSMIITSLIFGLYHGNLVQFVYASILGFFLAYFREKYQNIVAPILVHMVANLWSVFLTQFKDILTEETITAKVLLGILTPIAIASTIMMVLIIRSVVLDLIHLKKYKHFKQEYFSMMGRKR